MAFFEATDFTIPQAQIRLPYYHGMNSMYNKQHRTLMVIIFHFNAGIIHISRTLIFEHLSTKASRETVMRQSKPYLHTSFRADDIVIKLYGLLLVPVGWWLIAHFYLLAHTYCFGVAGCGRGRGRRERRNKTSLPHTLLPLRMAIIQCKHEFQWRSCGGMVFQSVKWFYECKLPIMLETTIRLIREKHNHKLRIRERRHVKETDLEPRKRRRWPD